MKKGATIVSNSKHTRVKNVNDLYGNMYVFAYGYETIYTIFYLFKFNFIIYLICFASNKPK